MADCLAAAAQSSAEKDSKAYNRLLMLEEQILKPMPKSKINRLFILGSSLLMYLIYERIRGENIVMSIPGDT